MLDPVRLTIDRLGRRGEGVASTAGRQVYVPFGLPGETVLADVDGERGHMLQLLAARPDRLAPFCPYYGRCGGCAVQTLPAEPYAAWKRDLVVQALRLAGLAPAVAPLVDAHGEGRRRVTVHARFGPHGKPPQVGFMETRSHRLVDIEGCPILSAGLGAALPVARRVAALLTETGKPLDILVTSTESGLDVDIRGLGFIDDATVLRLVAAAGELDLARVSNHGEILVEARAPRLHMGEAVVVMPPGAFLQATVKGEQALADIVAGAIGEARTVADLFCGLGTFALRSARVAAVDAWDNEPKAIRALHRAALETDRLRPVRPTVRDLMRRPLLAAELKGFDAVVFDPPRAGAAAQSAEIAISSVPTVVAISCDPGTFARDAATLVGGGYTLEQVTPVDQFRHSAHVEIAASFRRPRSKGKRRRLLS